ncbi:MAG: hypothetical protein AAFV88_14105 [Planctomycetota bacterium]
MEGSGEITLEQRQAIAVDAMQAEQADSYGCGSWVQFYRSIFGRDGSLARHLQPGQRRDYQTGGDYAELHERLAHLRSVDNRKLASAETVDMITIRVPRSMHDALIDEAKAAGVSMQNLCITKLVVPAHDRFIPEQRGKIRGRSFGPQPKESGSEESEQEAAGRDDGCRANAVAGRSGWQAETGATAAG